MARPQPIILAAGASSRFGHCKLLLEHRGKTLLQHCVDTLAPLGLSAPLIVTGAWHRQLVDAHPQLDLRENRDWQSGMGASLAFAIRQLPASCDAALVLLADQVAIDSTDIRRLLECWTEYKAIVCSFYADRRGVPAVFPREYFPQLAKLNSDRGARDLLRSEQYAITQVPVPNGAIDIDTQQDWKAWRLCRGSR
ncbi:nucleotidyltransferase family protein [Microbulbifer rhizosphaerae]|uniref:Molybdenum cofactor cytidylyltransferase n=1 Tax=Microbulbifer rhizosphaerae TaxID=1562603 RepID=A0A7W4W9G0_9GAMM|nr:nucleotidyltransferase family protein [Microbulbifer rhizosphaerae]MBB3059481.1 molybdenum cofactor cytidylyltransferase [Microbulbifer rhizosphaerae]